MPGGVCPSPPPLGVFGVNVFSFPRPPHLKTCPTTTMWRLMMFLLTVRGARGWQLLQAAPLGGSDPPGGWRCGSCFCVARAASAPRRATATAAVATATAAAQQQGAEPRCLHVDANGEHQVVRIADLPPAPRSRLRVVLVSDTHHQLQDIAIPPGDVFCHTGDITFCARGGFSTLSDFNEYVGQLPHPHKIVIAGNHDRHVEHIGKDAAKRLFSSAHYLENSGIKIRGLHFWGSPFSPVRAARALREPTPARMARPWRRGRGGTPAPDSPPTSPPAAEAQGQPLEQPRLPVLARQAGSGLPLHPQRRRRAVNTRRPRL